MSHEETIICPNCGSTAHKNYCSQCGQATHLHDETFTGLLGHFAAHYFHYESKFWQTVKTLWTKPGVLTVAYRNKQRMRYVQPMSLYIFTVVTYFILSSLVADVYSKLNIGNANDADTETYQAISEKKSSRVEKMLGAKAVDKLDYVLAHADDYDEHVTKILPKIFFFMVPIFAFFLSLLFVRNHNFTYLDHVIFSFHLHTLLFFVLFITDFFTFADWYGWILLFAFAALFIYATRAMMTVYGIKAIKAFVYSATALSLNFVVFIIFLVITIIWLV